MNAGGNLFPAMPLCRLQWVEMVPALATTQAAVTRLDWPCEIESQVPLGPLTWYGIGGTAQVLAHPASMRELCELVAHCRSSGLPFRVLGKGANLLVCEGTVRGVVVYLDRMKRVEMDAQSGRVVAEAGSDLEQLITATVRAGLAGLEVLAGIPATIGGAIRMNAGGAFGAIGASVARVTAVDPEGRIVHLPREQLSFTYRKSNLGERIVAEVEFALHKAEDPAGLRQRLKEVMKYKKDSQPMAASSAGCAFKNPPKEVSEKGAGRLIDEAGLKGLRIGGAEVSSVHANFIVLHEGGVASDVLAVMNRVQQSVAQKFGIQLEREVVVWETH